MSSDIENHGREIRISNKDFGVAYPVDRYYCIGSKILLLLKTFGGHAESLASFDKDVQIDVPSPSRNIICISTDGEVVWAVEKPSHPYSGKESYNIFKHMFLINDRLLAVHHNERIYEIDTDRGELNDSWEHNQLPFESRVIELAGPIHTVVNVDETIVVRIMNTDVDKGDVYAFDYDGNLLWRSDKMLGDIYTKDGTLHAKKGVAPRTSILYTIDPDSGEIIDEEEVPDMN